MTSSDRRRTASKGAALRSKIRPCSCPHEASASTTHCGGAARSSKAELPTLASELQLEADELLPIAETLQLMRFSEIDGRMIRLTPAGRRPAIAPTLQQKMLVYGGLAVLQIGIRAGMAYARARRRRVA